MFAIAFLAMVILALVSSTFYLLMRARLMRLDSAKDRIEWLSFRSSDDVLATYEALFPRSVLPLFAASSSGRQSYLLPSSCATQSLRLY
jgi:hypothetical protein